MNRFLTHAYKTALMVALVGVLERPATAQDAGTDAPTVPTCASLNNPIYLSGSTAFENTVKAFAVKFSALATPMTVVYHLPGSCVGVDNITNNKDLTGTAHYYTLSGTTITTNTCTLPASGQKADVGISDVFYASCTSNTPTAQPATLGDFPGPAQAMLMVVPKSDTTAKYITALELQDLYGCGAGFTGNTTPFTDINQNFCRDPNSGTQITVATNVNIPPTVMIAPVCVPESGTGGVVNALTMSTNAAAAIGFISEDAYDPQRANLNSLAFEAFGQTYAYYSDSSAATADRANVRDGHYGLWGYEHMMTTIDATTKLPTNAKAAAFIGYVNGTMTDPTIDYVQIEGKAGTIPVCAMKVQRLIDGGPLSYSSVTDSCGCAFEAAVSGAPPSECTACTAGADAAACPGSKSCHHGYCE